MKFAPSILILFLPLTITATPTLTTLSKAESAELHDLAYPSTADNAGTSGTTSALGPFEGIEERGQKERCQWGNLYWGKHGYGCYCASGCLDSTGVCNDPFGRCHRSGALKKSITALGCLMAVGAIAVGLL